MIKRKMISNKHVDAESILKDWEASDMISILSEENRFIKKIENENCKITVFIAEDYYLRINSTLTVTVIAEETVDATSVEIIVSGGKEGLLGLSYGAERNAAKRLVKLLKEKGFEEQ